MTFRAGTVVEYFRLEFYYFLFIYCNNDLIARMPPQPSNSRSSASRQLELISNCSARGIIGFLGSGRRGQVPSSGDSSDSAPARLTVAEKAVIRAGGPVFGWSPAWQAQMNRDPNDAQTQPKVPAVGRGHGAPVAC